MQTLSLYLPNASTFLTQSSATLIWPCKQIKNFKETEVASDNPSLGKQILSTINPYSELLGVRFSSHSQSLINCKIKSNWSNINYYSTFVSVFRLAAICLRLRYR